ncbi:MAG: KDO2-lipid IV(A) lauroyltransferase [Pelagibacterales bacterium]|nr:KDO2-lipid IV(A) lauroyltransferase [Pelagibacterales bacterium]
MKILKYFFEYLIIKFFFSLFIILGYRKSSNLGAIIISTIGPLFKSKKIIQDNIKKINNKIDNERINNIIKKMWSNYGRILSDYMFIKDFRNAKLQEYIEIEGSDILEKIKLEKKPVVFVSGHFNNFELMAMQIEKSGVKLATIYRPLNNFFLNKTMEDIRKKYICKHQIKKGLPGVRDMLEFFKKGYSIALMIDQRVSEGIKSNLFGQAALTTTIPAQLVKKFKCKVVPIYIQRINNFNYKIKINKPINFNQDESIENITQYLNNTLESMILKNPEQWILTHNRWK